MCQETFGHWELLLGNFLVELRNLCSIVYIAASHMKFADAGRIHLKYFRITVKGSGVKGLGLRGLGFRV